MVIGELVAFGSAIAAIPTWAAGRWFLYAAAIIGAGALAWYALDKSSLGEMPLTGVSAERIAKVARIVKAEEHLGPVVQWNTISADGDHAEIDLLKMKPEYKIVMARSMFERMTPVEAHGALGREWTEADADQSLRVVAPGPVRLRDAETNGNNGQN